MTLPALPVVAVNDCWNRIGVWGDRTCPELVEAVHCHNCSVFAAASRRFLDGPSLDGYLDEWTERLVSPIEEAATDVQSVLIFRLGDEWLALRVQVLLEVTTPRPIHRIPHRAGLLAGLVNIRGELHLCVRLAQLLGIAGEKQTGGQGDKETGRLRSNGTSLVSVSPGLPVSSSPAPSSQQHLIVVQRDGDRWVFPVEELDQVYRFSAGELTGAPATLARSAGRMTRGVFVWRDRSIGYLDDARLFQVLRTRIQ